LFPALVARGDHLWMLRLTLVTAGAFTVLGILSLYGLSRRLRWLSAGTITAVALLVFPRVDLWLSVMEAGPAMGVLLLTIYLCHRYELMTSERTWHHLLFGLLMAMVFLVRLDQVFIVIAMFVGSLYMRWHVRQSLRTLLRGILTSGVFATLIVLPYLAANEYYFGHFVPVSGLKKHVLADSMATVLYAAFRPVITASRKTGLPVWVVAVLIVAMVGLGLYAVRSARRRGKDVPQIGAAGVVGFFALGVVARWAYLRVFVSKESASVPWYWVSEYVLFCIVAGYVAACVILLLPDHLRSSRGWRGIGHAAVVGVAALGTLYVLVDSTRNTEQSMLSLKTALWAKANLPSDRLCAMYDSGKFSFFSQLNTVPLNGLISDERTMLESQDRCYNGIMDRLNVDYLVTYLRDEQVAAVPSGGLVYKADHKFTKGVFQNTWLCILDWRVYSPHEK